MGMIEYEDFSIKIEPQREGLYPVIVLRSPAGQGQSSFRLPVDPDELGDLGEMVRSTGPKRDAVRHTIQAPDASQALQGIGDRLFNALFAGLARSLFDQSLGMIRERQKGLRIKLHIDPEEASLASLPWELLYRKETRDFLSLSRSTPIVRYLDVPVPCDPQALEPPLRILVVISSPIDYPRLNLEHERAQIERSWAQQENVEVRFLEKPTMSQLQDRLEREPFHVLHYMGHGGFDDGSGSGVLLLEGEAGQGVQVKGPKLKILLRDVPTLRLVFLNACETARVTNQVSLDPFAGVAAAIVLAGAPAVVAMQFPISDEAAIRFASRFYALVARGEPVDYAVAEGRQAICVAESDTMEWATPILFMRVPDGVVFRVAGAAAAADTVGAGEKSIDEKSALFDVGHNQSGWGEDFPDPRRALISHSDFGDFADVVRDLGLHPNETTELSERTLKIAPLLVLVLPLKRRYTENEVRDIQAFVRSGGRLLSLSFYGGDPHFATNLNDVLERTGITTMPVRVMVRKGSGASESEVIGYPSEGNDFLPDGEKVFMSYCCALALDMEKNPSARPILWSSDDSLIQQVELRDGRVIDFLPESQGRQPLGAVAEYGRGRIAVLGSWQAFTNDSMNKKGFANRLLLETVLKWLLKGG
jgi:hypothetical protein